MNLTISVIVIFKLQYPDYWDPVVTNLSFATSDWDSNRCGLRRLPGLGSTDSYNMTSLSQQFRASSDSEDSQLDRKKISNRKMWVIAL
jgi:hypothetical protein